MIPYERKEKITQILAEVEYMKIEDLLLYFPQTSLSTLRRDLKKLSDQFEVQFLSGGAVKARAMVSDLSFIKKNNLYVKEKEKIAEVAVSLIQDGDTIFLDAGTSCLHLYKKISNRKIRIFTTNSDVFGVTSEISAEIIFLGGRYIPSQASVNGPMTMSLLENIYFDKAFLGANAVSVESGITTATLEEANKKRLVFEHSVETYFLCDSTKFNKRASIKIIDLEKGMIISDKNDKKISDKTKVIYR